MINLPFQFLGSEDRITSRGDETELRVTRRTDLTWGRPLFQAPVLRNPRQREEDLRFAADFRTKDWLKR